LAVVVLFRDSGSVAVLHSVERALSALVEHPALVLEHPAPWGSCLRGDCTEKSAKWCSKCKDAKYCSSECQQMDWPSHSLNCEEAARCKKTAKLMMKRMLLC
jgi:hypothetical protein